MTTLEIIEEFRAMLYSARIETNIGEIINDGESLRKYQEMAEWLDDTAAVEAKKAADKHRSDLARIRESN